MKAATPKARPRGRPRREGGGSDAIVDAILEETAKQLGQGGLESLSVEDVARAVGVNKTTIYRRWPTRARLVVAAIHAQRDRVSPFKRTGDLRRDLAALLMAKAKNMATPRGRRITQALVALGESEGGDLDEALREAAAPTPAALLSEAIARGEIAEDVDVAFAGEMLSAPIVHRVLVLGKRVDEAFVERVVDHVLSTLAPPVRSLARKKQR